MDFSFPKWLFVGFSTFLVGSASYGLGAFQNGDLQLYDWAYRFFHSNGKDERIAIVGIDEEDIAQYGYPLTDEKLFNLLNRVKEGNPVAIGLDIYRNIPLPPGSARLNQFFNSYNRIYGIEKVVEGEGEETVEPNPILKRKKQSTSSDMIPDPDGKIRRSLLFAYPKDNPNLPSLHLVLALEYLSQKHQILPNDVPGGWVSLGKQTFYPFQSFTGGYAKVDAGGYQLPLKFLGSPGTFQIIPLRQVLRGEVQKDVFTNKLVLIGYTAPSVNDLHYTPFSERMAGVEIQGHAISGIISAALDEQRPLLLLPWFFNVIGLLIVNLSLAYWLWRSSSVRKSGLIFLSLILGVSFIWLVGIYFFCWFALLPHLATLSVLFPVLLNLKHLENLQLLTRSLAKTIDSQQQELTQAQKLATLGRISAAIGHEIKNPVAHIVSLCEFLQRSSVDETRKVADLLVVQALRVDRIVSDVLSFSYSSSVEKLKVDLDFLLENSLSLALDSLNSELRERQVETVIDVSSDLEIHTDPHLLQRALVNIMKNALEASFSCVDDTIPEVFVRAYRQENYIIISIGDNGCGIAEEHIDRIFEPFFTTKTKMQGTGLGLWIAYESISRLGGRIEVSSEVGHYAEFNIWLESRSHL